MALKVDSTTWRIDITCAMLPGAQAQVRPQQPAEPQGRLESPRLLRSLSSMPAKLTLLLRAQPHLSLHGLFLRGFPLGVDHVLRLLLPEGAHDALVGDLGRLEVAIQRIAAHLGIHRSETRDPVVLSVLGPRVTLSS